MRIFPVLIPFWMFFPPCLVRPAAVDHVQRGPAVLGLYADGRTDKQVEAELALKIVLLDVVGQGDRHFFRISGGGEARPAEAHAVFEHGDDFLGFYHFGQKGWASDPLC